MPWTLSACWKLDYLRDSAEFGFLEVARGPISQIMRAENCCDAAGDLQAQRNLDALQTAALPLTDFLSKENRST